MLTILRFLLSKAGWLVISFFAIISVLALWNEFPTKLRDWSSQASNSEQVATQLTDSRPAFEQSVQSAVRGADDDIRRLRQASRVELERVQRDIERQRQSAQARVLDDKAIAWAAATGGSEKIVASIQAQYVELPLLDRAARLIEIRHVNLTRRADRRQFNEDVAKYNSRLAERNQWQRQASSQIRWTICRRAPSLPGCELVRRIAVRDRQLQREKAELEQRRASVNRALLGEQVDDAAQIITRATGAYADKAQQLSENASSYALNKAKAAFRRYGIQAFGILLVAILLPILHKLFAFFVLAPLATHAKPITLSSPGASLVGSQSGMSAEVQLTPDTELLLRSRIQSSSTSVKGSDKVVLDWGMPLTCVAAGLVNLQRLRSNQIDHLVVTGTDAEHRVSTIEVPAGGAVVLQPRALLGMIKPCNRALVITRPWRLFSLVSWLTVQFRYVVFHGPCTLIVQGRNGVQIEDSSNGRMINKRLTIGFDAGIAYGAARSPSFLPYLRGEASLFNDRFEGDGRYIYEQRADSAGKGSIWGRGLKGLGDAILSALGI